MAKTSSSTPLIKKSVNIPEPIYLRAQKLIENGLYRNFSELMLDALKLLLQKYQLL